MTAPKAPLLDAAGKSAKTVSLEAAVFGADVKPHLVHYYFRTIDDLVLELVRTHGALGLKNTARAIASDEPLRALWELEMSYKWGVVAMELGSLAVTPPEPGPVTLMCGHGERAMTAASLLARHGHPSLAVAIGGPPDWAAAHGRPLETGG